MHIPKIKPEFLAVLLNENSPRFTVPQLTLAYARHSQCHLSGEPATRQFVMRNIKRLEAHGFVKTVAEATHKPVQFFFTPAFREAYLAPKQEKVVLPPSSQKNVNRFLKSLQEKLKENNKYLLSSQGEIEMYDAICKEFPEKTDAIQNLYNDVRDNRSKAIGRINALEALITDNQNSTF